MNLISYSLALATICAISACVAPPRCYDATSCQLQQMQADRNAQAAANAYNAATQNYMDGKNRELQIRQQNYENSVRQQQQYQQQQQSNTYIQQGKCYTDAFAVQRCY